MGQREAVKRSVGWGHGESAGLAGVRVPRASLKNACRALPFFVAYIIPGGGPIIGSAEKLAGWRSGEGKAAPPIIPAISPIGELKPII